MSCFSTTGSSSALAPFFFTALTYSLAIAWKIAQSPRLARLYCAPGNGGIAEHAEFFSFGTNDLTQTTFGISRDDAETGFLSEYLQKGILQRNPFATLDQAGVGQLIEIGVRLGRQRRKGLEIGICGDASARLNVRNGFFGSSWMIGSGSDIR